MASLLFKKSIEKFVEGEIFLLTLYFKVLFNTDLAMIDPAGLIALF